MTIQWDEIKKEVIMKINLFEKSVEALPEPTKSNYIENVVTPAFRHLARFCECVQVSE